ncbi:thioester reductase domain-containing protein [Streptomyces clavuligerus]|uniref:thioester reductase domain-containing protein n=1 Tax=Streptomyces clavuligerus TaxID=1901 RepID=UPI0003045563|nr:thioester reductase domain-containing protein [Streptomyces clavuligerus]WDN57366.1 thioester reductase domain-containing protein [Streptomyces clavuligerus]
MGGVPLPPETARLVGADLVLPYEAVPERLTPARPGDAPGTVLLTGATGYLGGYLLTDLLRATRWRVRCLVRGEDTAAARGRLAQALAGHRVPAADAERLSVVPGSLARPRFGLGEAEYGALAAEVGAVYHCAASVNLASGYSVVRTANVTGTVRVLAFAVRAGGVPVHHVSTLGVVLRRFAEGAGPIVEDDPLPEPVDIGYCQSKFVAELLVGEAGRRGLPVSVYRPGVVLPSTRGNAAPGDWFMRLTEASVRAGCFPVHRFPLAVAPVDRTSRVIADLSLHDAARGGVFHTVEREPLWFQEYFGRVAATGFPMEPVPYARWVAEVERLPGVAPGTVRLAGLLPRILPPGARGRVWVSSERTHRLLPAPGAAPAFDDGYFGRMLDDLRSKGARLDPPPGGRL